MIYWFADFPGEPARFAYNAAQFQRDWDWLIKLSEEIDSASSYPLTEDRQKCAFCTYRSYCERGIRAGDLGRTWRQRWHSRGKFRRQLRTDRRDRVLIVGRILHVSPYLI